MQAYIRNLKRELIIKFGRLIPDNLSILIYKKIFDSKRLINTKIAKYILISIACKGIKKEIIRTIQVFLMINLQF